MKLRSLLVFLLLPVLAYAQGIPTKDQNSSRAADVETCGAGAALNCVKVDTGQDAATAGFARLSDQLGRAIWAADDSVRTLAVTGTRTDYANQVEGTALDARILSSTTTTMTITQASNFITLNGSAITTINTNARISTHIGFQYYDTQGLAFAWSFKRPAGQTGQTNETVEMGAFFASGGTAPTDGLFFRWNASGEFRAVSTYNSTESTVLLTSPTANVTHMGVIVRRATGTDYWIDGTKVASIEEAANANPVSPRGLVLAFRVAIGGSAPGVAPQLLVGPQAVRRFGDMDKPYSHSMSNMGGHSMQSPLTPYAQTSNHANSTSPTSATLSNTAAGYTTLGGRYQFAAPAAAATDFALFGFQIPAIYQLVVTSVVVTACNTGAAVATTATILDWGVGVNSTAVSLATADSFGPPFTTQAPRRIPLGMQGFPLVAPNGPVQIGDCARDIVRAFDPPLVVQAGKFFHVILQVPVGTATASQVIRGDVQVNGYFE